MHLIDTHLHLDYFDKSEIDEIITAARSQNVLEMLSVSTKLSEFENLLSIALQYDKVWLSYGIHPNSVESEREQLGSNFDKNLVKHHDNSRVIAIGETGLDYFYNKDKSCLQKQSFRQHIEASAKYKLPIVIHSREADSDMIEMVKFSRSLTGWVGGVLHCYTSGLDLAKVALDAGFYISFTGIVTFKTAKAVQDIAKYVPLDRIMIETDSPYLAPNPKRGKRNQPSFLPYICSYLSQLLSIDTDRLTEINYNNFKRLFPKSDI